MDAKSQPCRDDLKMGRKRWVMKEVMWGCWCSIDKERRYLMVGDLNVVCLCVAEAVGSVMVGIVLNAKCCREVSDGNASLHSI